MANFTIHSVIPETMTPETERFLLPARATPASRAEGASAFSSASFSARSAARRSACWRSWWTSSSRARLAHFWAEAPP